VAEPLLVVGLGNPGPRYATTRHNFGYLVADVLADRMGAGAGIGAGIGARIRAGIGAGSGSGRGSGGNFKAHKRSGADVLTGRLAGHPVVLAKPRSFMNESGRQVAALAKFYSVPPSNLIVIHDELDLDFGQIRLKLGGGEAGHNGLRSVSAALSTNEYQRVRIGVGRPPGRKDPATFVLENFAPAERREVPVICEQAADATELLIKLGLEAAQNQVHSWS
jgi:PTH1 family peptidyl-tRNA hydrolase